MLKTPLEEQTSQLDMAAAQLKERTITAFTSSPSSSAVPLFAYVTDGCGNHIFYHDGNDVPTSFAKDWGFVSTSEEVVHGRLQWGSHCRLPTREDIATTAHMADSAAYTLLEPGLWGISRS